MIYYKCMLKSCFRAYKHRAKNVLNVKFCIRCNKLNEALDFLPLSEKISKEQENLADIHTVRQIEEGKF